MTSLKNKTIFITGGSRGVGRSIALRAAQDGANVVIASKTASPHPTLPGTIYTVAKEIEEAGGKALPLEVDVRSEDQVASAVEKTAQTFGGIDILVNNASAIHLSNTLETSMKKFDLMFSVNVRATFATSQACIPYLKKAQNPHILTMSPPLNMESRWFKDHVAYTMSKYGMSMCVLGMAAELKQAGIAVNALWPRTVLATAAVQMIGGDRLMQASRKPEITSDAAYEILTRDSRTCTGNFFVDEDVLASTGMTDFSHYDSVPGIPPMPDFFL